ncbi:MAG: 3-dehydroquinate synthase [Clostridia bacterium]|nr:3-dehydroquinate synthase [Clostridia bacterium]
MTERIRVNASESYDVVIGEGILSSAAEAIEEALGKPALMIVSDDNVFPLYGEKLKKLLAGSGFRVESFVFPHGEKSKSLKTYGELAESLCRARFTRSDAIIALGGGVVGDLAGFAAATYQRGIRFVQIPTSLLACVDSSVGGKTGVDLESGKNQVGCFHQPSLVICDTETLNTLPPEQYSCGCAEIIKYAVIGSEKFFRELEKTPVSERYGSVIGTCVRMKRDIVEKDEFDRGLRMTLNFGHTFGHAAEACSGYSVLHGQAVAMGMAAITKSAAAQGICPADMPERIDGILGLYGLPTRIPYRAEDIKKAVLVDKKNAGGSVRLIVPEAIGRCRTENVPADKIGLWLEKGGIL